MFVLISMYFSWWFKIWSQNSTIWTFFYQICYIFDRSSALACRMESININLGFSATGPKTPLKMHCSDKDFICLLNCARRAGFFIKLHRDWQVGDKANRFWFYSTNGPRRFITALILCQEYPVYQT